LIIKNNNILNTIKTPAWVLNEKLLIKNLETIKYLKDKTGAKVLLALKGYSLWSSFNIIEKYLDGCCASGLHEAMLANEEFKGEVHTYSPAFKDDEIEKISKISHHLVFNSPSQFKKYSKKAKAINPDISIGLRVNPEYSSSPTELYNPCGLYSRLGTTISNFDETILENCDDLHFHALCEQDSSALKEVLLHFEEKFGKYIKNMKWVNFGGGHHITKNDYDLDGLIDIINKFKEKYKVDVYLEPGEAIGWETGVLVSEVLDIVDNGMEIAIVDVSTEAHMPDTIIMPYRAEIRDADKPSVKKFNYRIAGNSCIAGDVMGDYSFDSKLKIGDKIIFEDQIHYTMVKATTFNGVKLPSIVVIKEDNSVEIIKEFGYNDFKNRLS